MNDGFCGAMAGAPESMQIVLGAAIQRHRRARGWSQEALAERLDVTTAYVSLLERGERTPAMPMLVALAKVFGTSIDALFGWSAEDEWMQEAQELLKSVPSAARPAVTAMLRGVVAHTEPSSAVVSKKRDRSTPHRAPRGR